MTELWELCGPSWRLPLLIEWHDTLGCIQSFPIPLLKVQVQAVDQILLPFVFSQGGRVWICKPDLLKIAHKSERTNPEEIVEWLPVRGPTKLVSEMKDNSFITGYCSSHFAISRDAVAMDAIWVSFCQYMLHWLVNHEREIDFGFMRVVPLCFRKNWSNAAAKWELSQYRLKRIFRSDFLKPDYDSMIRRGAAEHLTSPSLTAYDQKNKCPRPCLEVIEGKEFYAASVKREKARRQSWYGTYWYQVLERLKRQLPAAMEIYEHYLSEAKTSICGIYTRHDRGRKAQQSPLAYTCSGEKAAGHWGEAHTLFPENLEKDETGDLPSQAGPLPDEMPGV